MLIGLYQPQDESRFQPQQQLQLIPFDQKGIDNFFQQIRLRGQDDIVEVALLHGLTVSRLNENSKQLKEIKQMPFEDKWIKGGIYYGQCVDGLRNGYGLLYCTNDGDPFLFECEWGDTVKGRQIWIEGDKYMKFDGQFDEGYLRTGNGSWLQEDGVTYLGEWKDDQKHGFGKFTWLSGAIYEGEWVNGKKQGQGRYRWPDDKIFEGEWKEDKRHGRGRITMQNGDYQIGMYEYGKNTGVHNYFSREGKLIEKQTFENGIVVKTETI
ncbi:hypothetical protein FGO68_gene410 [Halteria grandinella]|uniref:MORN repeat protein n=1 Tax=Halteria grandinella TaxID=5974 RepID=A0A8J8NVV2_HALGN|nr:hypothetical protein FGO68_gene410 [Halteria grandinella]